MFQWFLPQRVWRMTSAKCKMKWRGKREAYWKRDAPAEKKKNVTGRQIWI